jgi:hypothetical protein
LIAYEGMLVSSIEEVAARLRQGLALLAIEPVEQGAMLWDEARADLMAAAWGSQTYELPEAIRMVEHGLEMLREAYASITGARASAERYLAHLVGDGGGGVVPGGQAGVLVRPARTWKTIAEEQGGVKSYPNYDAAKRPASH